MVWPSNFSARSEVPTQEFVKAYEEKYGELPNNYAAEGYDAVWLLARGIKEANSADRVAIREGIAKVAAEGFDGAQGPQLREQRRPCRGRDRQLERLRGSRRHAG